MLIPLALKLAYSLFVAVLVPYYWMTYSAWNFLFFCDLALFVGLCRFLARKPATDEPGGRGHHGATAPLGGRLPAIGARITGMTSYMFDSKLPIFVRALSSFHGWLPFLLVWGVWRLGYDRRAFVGWTIIGTLILLSSFFLAPKPPAPAANPDQAVNINYVHGLSYAKPQTVMHPWLWLSIMIVGFPIVFYLPAHLAFRALIPPPAVVAPAASEPVPAAT